VKARREARRGRRLLRRVGYQSAGSISIQNCRRPKTSRACSSARASSNAARDVVGAELVLARTKVAMLEKLLADAAVGRRRSQKRSIRAAVEAGLLDRLAGRRSAQAQGVRAAPSPIARSTRNSGAEIRVGRTAKDNDDLTFHHATATTSGCTPPTRPASHVVLRIAKRCSSRATRTCSTQRISRSISLDERRAQGARAHRARARKSTSRAAQNPASSRSRADGSSTCACNPSAWRGY
jgi:hypothetical protein